jgi:hypothetical protein
MAKFHLIPIVLGAAIGVGVYVVSKYLAQDEESEQIVDDSAFDDSEASESTEDADETEENADEEPPAEEPAAEPAPDVPDADAKGTAGRPAPGSLPYVVGAEGLLIAGEVVRRLTQNAGKTEAHT